MRKTDLIEGETYILNGINDTPGTRSVVCRYEGPTDGRLELADGAVYHAGPQVLQFRVTHPDDRAEIVLCDTGIPVIETAQTRAERERRHAEKAERLTALRTQALRFLAGLGITEVYVPGGDARDSFDRTYQASLLSDPKDTEVLQVSGLRVSELRRIVDQARADGAREAGA